MLRQIDLGRALTALGALLLLVALFLDWYEAGGTAWEVFEVVDLLLAALALAAIAAALLPGDRADAVLRWGPWAALVVVVVSLLNPPPILQLATDALELRDAGDPDTGAWLALAGSALMATGALLALARISVVVDVAARGRREPPAGARTAAPPETPDAAPTERAIVQDPAIAPPAPRSMRKLIEDDHPHPAPGEGTDPGVHPAEPVKPGAAHRDPAELEHVDEVPAVDRREQRAPVDEPDPTQPLRPEP
ncbi:MAG TPA: hypothetical protein VD931_08000 [Baekduia sp.]|nr:hypothetical protein [Baekduia sp.]